MLRLRTGSLALVCAAALAACSNSQPPPAVSGRGSPAAPVAVPVVANFEGQYDPATGKLTVAMITPELTTPGGLSISLPFNDNNFNTNPDNTFQLATDPAATSQIVTGGCGAVNAFEGPVQVRSFFRNQALRNVYAEITWLSATDNSGCNGEATAPAGTTAGMGLWSYGDLAAGGAVTQLWRFRLVTAGAFSFRGRVMADLDPVVHLGGAPEFDWTPTALAAKKSFKPIGSTMAHLVWNGTTWVNNSGPAISFQTVGSPTSTYSAIPGAPYAGGFTSGNYFIADNAHGGNLIDTSSNFTVCAKIKPGPHPGMVPMDLRRVYVAKGKPEPGGEGWALMQMHSAYCFHYRTQYDDTSSPARGDVMTFKDLSEYAPGTYAYDYICGGRATATWQIFLMARGLDGYHDTDAQGRQSDIDYGTFTAPSSLPLVIGAYPDGTMPGINGGVYEVIFDNRPASLTVMREIVAAAENASLDGSPSSYVLFDPLSTATVQVVGNDAATYTLPPISIPPAALDGSGLLEAGRAALYGPPLTENTSTTGYCVGAEVVPTGTWAGVSGGVFGFADVYSNWATSALYMTLGPLTFTDGGAVVSDATVLTGSASHVFMACKDPTTDSNGYSLWVDGTERVAVNHDRRYVADLSASGYRFHVGEGGGTALTGARIRRVFACPFSDGSLCH